VLQQHRASRCTVDITLQTTTGKHEVIGKVYAKDRSDVYRAMKQISQSGFGPEEEFSIPQPFAFVPQLNLLLQEKVHGPLATEIFLTGSDGERATTAERSARWLAHFHAYGPLSGPAFFLTSNLMEGWVDRLGGPYGRLASKARLLFRRLQNTAMALRPTEMCACHGGYWHKQIIFTETRTITFDWDNHCISDPCRDVARFIIELKRLALKSYGSIKALDTTIDVFFKSYSSTSRFEVTTNLPLYKAAVCLKRAKSHLRSAGSGPEHAEAMLDEGLRVLAEEG
jgi:aminoglycoside phosphotransferase (APT) family kinase protein